MFASPNRLFAISFTLYTLFLAVLSLIASGADRVGLRVFLVRDIAGMGEMWPATPTLQKYSRLTNTVYFNDKIVKSVGYLAGVAAEMLQHGGGAAADDERVVGLRAACSWLGFARYAARIPNQIGDSVNAVRTDAWSDPRFTHPQLKVIARNQARCNIAYHLMEHVALAGYVAPTLVKVDADKWTWMSCWLWTYFVVKELQAIRLRLAELRARREKARKAGGDAVAQAAELAEIKKLVHNQRGQWIRFLLFLPNALHWSWGKKGFLPSWFVNVTGLAEGVYGTWLMWHHDS